jgi:dihydropteroate synthase
VIYEFGNLKYDMFSRTYVMGILNITPDSFSDGGKYYRDKLDLKKVIEDSMMMEKEGADFIDIGGESTRPGSDKITPEEELTRVIPVIESIKKKIDIPISIDTYKSEVAEESLKAGALIVNDISGFNFDQTMPEIVRKYNASCIVMHIKGTPKNMQKNPEYDDVVDEVYNYLENSVGLAQSYGIKQIITDPGIGFGKTFEHNIELIKNLKKFRKLDYPVLLGASRKSFLNKIFPSETHNRLEGTIAVNVAGILNGANIVRVHDVAQNVRAAKAADAIKKSL